jgi:hypothetical protein
LPAAAHSEGVASPAPFPQARQFDASQRTVGYDHLSSMTSGKNLPSAASLAVLLSRFVAHFTRAIRQEMEAMRERRGSFEVVLSGGHRDELDTSETSACYTFKALSPDEKLVAGLECTLRTSDAEHLVRVHRIDGHEVTVQSERSVRLDSGQAVLVIYPWFLYEKLLKVLENISPDRHSVEQAMTLFGKLDASSCRRPLLRAHLTLNASQRAAVQLCSDSNLAFVWGPPGTGKTTTLASIVGELLAQGLRVVVLSTTNAALDQALAKIAADPETKEAIDDGRVVRIGRCDGPAFGAALRDVVVRLSAVHQKALDRLTDRRPAVAHAVRRCEQALVGLAGADAPVQESLFGGATSQRPLATCHRDRPPPST